MTRFSAPIAEQIWDMKYRLKDADGTPIDGTVEDSWRRIARALAAVEDEPAAWEERFYAALEDFRYLPAGRITAGAGTGAHGDAVQLLRHGHDPRQHGRHLRHAEGGRADHAAGRRHRL